MTVSALNQYVFPANLQYFAKSTIKTSIASQKSLYDGVNPWSTILAAYTNGGEVKSATKSVAIEDPINYGVGLLEADIQFTSGLKDNTDAAYTVTNPLSWSAILIGDQKRVDYEFRQVTSAESRLIYDKHMNGSLTGNPISMPNYGTTYGPNYTLVLGTQDNGEAGESHPDKVYFAVELVNTNETFFGHNNQIIPSGSKFYLVGELQVTSETGSHPEKFNIFYKDYTTTIHMTIGPNSLQNAYSTIPDLRSEGLELGFSVDLSWTPGLVFDVEF